MTIEYENVLEEKDQEKRMEIILIDAYGEDEQQEAFCCYVEDHISFPFEAKMCGGKGSNFTVLGFASLRPNRISCEINIGGAKSRMPLDDIMPVDKESANYIVISDYVKFIEG